MNSESKTEQSTNNTKEGSEICLLDLSQKEPYTNTQKAIMAIKAFVLAYFGFFGSKIFRWRAVLDWGHWDTGRSGSTLCA